jgi:glucose/arabinose dehydrogenase
VDCDQAIDSVDSLRILRYIVQLQNPAVPGCPAIGAPLAGSGTPALSPTPTPSGTATPAATPTASVGGTPTATPTPNVFTCPSPTSPTGATPRPEINEGSYRLTNVYPDASWVDMLDFALIPGSSNAAVVVEQNGRVWRISLDSSFGPTIFADLDPIVKSGGEEGLLSLAFSPDFQSDGRVYVYYTRGSPNPSVLTRFQSNDVCMNTQSEAVILQIDQPYANHNGGSVRFGQDGYLYLSLGDGGSGGDPQNHAQDKESLLGKVLRLNVTGVETYSFPPDNPFVGTAGRDEIFAYGFRNPWRMSMDRQTGDIWLGDVGQGAWEEVDRVVAGGNYGWRCYEGFAEFDLSEGCSGDQSDYVLPRAAYGHGGGNQAITGGYVYRGNDMPELNGWYVYGDAYSGRIWAVNTADSSDPVLLMNTDEFIYSFAELEDGELLVLTAGGIYRLAPA